MGVCSGHIEGKIIGTEGLHEQKHGSVKGNSGRGQFRATTRRGRRRGGGGLGGEQDGELGPGVSESGVSEAEVHQRWLSLCCRSVLCDTSEFTFLLYSLNAGVSLC